MVQKAGQKTDFLATISAWSVLRASAMAALALDGLAMPLAVLQADPEQRAGAGVLCVGLLLIRGLVVYGVWRKQAPYRGWALGLGAFLSAVTAINPFFRFQIGTSLWETSLLDWLAALVGVVFIAGLFLLKRDRR